MDAKNPVRELLERHVGEGLAPGMVAVLARRGEVDVVATGTLAFEGAGAETPMGADTIVRMASSSKPVTAACAMTLVEDGTLGLDDPIDRLIPEMSGMLVLADPAGPLDDTVPAERAITLRDLLTCTLGTGMVEDGPIAAALNAVPTSGPDEFVRGLGALPLVRQPGAAWMYDTASDVLGVLVARATGKTFGQALDERILAPLGMADTGFTVRPPDLGRFATAYEPEGSAVENAPDERWTRPPAFESGGGGLVSTATDYLAFVTALASGGGPILSRAAVTLMTTDHLTPGQKSLSGFGPHYFDDFGWGFGLSVRTRRTPSGPSAGTYGWPGFYGTAWYHDPAADLTTILLMQRAHMGDQRRPFWTDFWSAVYRSI